MDKVFRTFIPESKIPETATVRQLPNHTVGLSDYFGRSNYCEALHAQPDRPWSYALLKELIEKLSSLGYFEFLEKFILCLTN